MANKKPLQQVSFNSTYSTDSFFDDGQWQEMSQVGPYFSPRPFLACPLKSGRTIVLSFRSPC